MKTRQGNKQTVPAHYIHTMIGRAILRCHHRGRHPHNALAPSPLILPQLKRISAIVPTHHHYCPASRHVLARFYRGSSGIIPCCPAPACTLEDPGISPPPAARPTSPPTAPSVYIESQVCIFSPLLSHLVSRLFYRVPRAISLASPGLPIPRLSPLSLFSNILYFPQTHP